MSEVRNWGFLITLTIFYLWTRMSRDEKRILVPYGFFWSFLYFPIIHSFMNHKRWRRFSNYDVDFFLLKRWMTLWSLLKLPDSLWLHHCLLFIVSCICWSQKGRAIRQTLIPVLHSDLHQLVNSLFRLSIALLIQPQLTFQKADHLIPSDFVLSFTIIVGRMQFCIMG